mgnify:CR=1 FL=1
MKFDKSKVCVAGLHEVKEGTLGWFADSINELEEYATQNSVNECLAKMKGQRDCLYVDELNTVWRFFYPLPKNQYRPYKTIEEALTLKGKWLKHKSWDCFFEVTKIEMLNGSAIINNIESSFLYEMYTMEDGTPIGIPE